MKTLAGKRSERISVTNKQQQQQTNRHLGAPMENLTHKPLQNPPPRTTTRPKGLVYLALQA